MNRRRTRGLLAAGVLIAGALVAWLAPRPVLALWLVAWWFGMGVVMGGLGNVWIHTLSGGPWGEAIRAPAFARARGYWLLALLFLPVLVRAPVLYSWMSHAADGVARWSGELDPGLAGFKSAWLTPGFFVARSLGYLAAWGVLAAASDTARWSRSPRFAAFALLVYALTVSLAAVDWIMSLDALWYSSVFGLLVMTGQLLAGLALAVLDVARVNVRGVEDRLRLRDLGNLLLMYVLGWAYLAFVQYLIIWANDLPHEIRWYLPRLHGAWGGVALALVLFHFALPLVILLFRAAKQAPQVLGGVAIGLLLFHLADAAWMILPSVGAP